MDLKRAKQIRANVDIEAGCYCDVLRASWDETFQLLDLAIQRLTQREALRKKAAKRRKMMKRGGGK